MNIFLVDKNEHFRNNLKLYLEGHLNHVVTGEISDEKGFSENTEYNADIILMDIKNSSLFNTERPVPASKYFKEFKKIALSQHKETLDKQDLLSAGFSGFVSKENIYRDLENAINTVVLGKYFFLPEISGPQTPKESNIK